MGDLQNKMAAADFQHLQKTPPPQPLEVLLGMSDALSPEQSAKLVAAGFVPLSSIGPVVAGQVSDVAALERVAGLLFIDRIELSRPMRTE